MRELHNDWFFVVSRSVVGCKCDKQYRGAEMFIPEPPPVLVCIMSYLLMSSVQRDWGLFERTRMESLPFLSVRMLTVAFFTDGPPPK